MDSSLDPYFIRAEPPHDTDEAVTIQRLSRHSFDECVERVTSPRHRSIHCEDLKRRDDGSDDLKIRCLLPVAGPAETPYLFLSGRRARDPSIQTS